jgi:hypothetical protein
VRPCDARSGPFCKSIENAADTDAAPTLDANDIDLFIIDNVMPAVARSLVRVRRRIRRLNRRKALEKLGRWRSKK